MSAQIIRGLHEPVRSFHTAALDRITNALRTCGRIEDIHEVWDGLRVEIEMGERVYAVTIREKGSRADKVMEKSI